MNQQVPNEAAVVSLSDYAESTLRLLDLFKERIKKEKKEKKVRERKFLIFIHNLI